MNALCAGDLFAVPLSPGGYAVGILARARPRGKVVLAYFFGPRWDTVPELGDVMSVRAESSVLIALVSTLGLKDGSWQIVGQQTPFDPAAWPMPRFASVDPITGKTWEISCSERDPMVEVGRRVVDGSGERLPSDGLLGHVLVERRLSTLLIGSNNF